MTLEEIAEVLSDRGVKPLHGGSWRPSSVAKALEMPLPPPPSRLVSALEDIDVRHAQAEARWRALLAEALVATLSDPVSALGVRIAGRDQVNTFMLGFGAVHGRQ